MANSRGDLTVIANDLHNALVSLNSASARLNQAALRESNAALSGTFLARSLQAKDAAASVRLTFESFCDAHGIERGGPAGQST